MMDRYYLDHNATAPIRPEVIEAVTNAMRCDGNSLSVHQEGRAANEIVERARDAVRTLINAPDNGIIFTSGGTESIHYALHGALMPQKIKRIFVSAIEHAAVRANAETTGAKIEIVPALPSGKIDLNWVRDRFSRYDIDRDGQFLFCLMFANNETGVVQPVREASAIVKKVGGLLFCDAAQAVGKIPVNFDESGADIMALTGHKFGGPVGIGALIVRRGLTLNPILRGGGHESNRRAGTHNVPAIAGLGLACTLAEQSLSRIGDIAALRNKCQEAAISAGAIIWGADQERLPGTLCLSAPGFSGATQLMTLDLAGISVSSGTACSSGKTKPSHVLIAMGANEEEATSAIRVSLGWNSTAEDANAFIREWPAAYARIKARVA